MNEVILHWSVSSLRMHRVAGLRRRAPVMMIEFKSSRDNNWES